MCMFESCTDLRPKSLSHGPTSRRNWLVSYIPLGGTSKIITLHEPKESTSTSADMTYHFFSAVGISLRKQPAFRYVTTGFPGKWRLRNERKNSILMTGHYPELQHCRPFCFVAPRQRLTNEMSSVGLKTRLYSWEGKGLSIWTGNFPEWQTGNFG